MSAKICLSCDGSTGGDCSQHHQGAVGMFCPVLKSGAGEGSNKRSISYEVTAAKKVASSNMRATSYNRASGFKAAASNMRTPSNQRTRSKTRGMNMEAPEAELENAQKTVMALAQVFKLNKEVMDMALLFFKKVLEKQMFLGYRSSQVIAACVYTACKTQRTGHMLIDISDILKEDVYELARVHQLLSRELDIQTPKSDLGQFVKMYADQLEIGMKTHEVATTAFRLASRVNKDWGLETGTSHHGRRPSAVFGAALYLACRRHGVPRTSSLVAKVVGVTELTLTNKIRDLEETPASQLTLDEILGAQSNKETEVLINGEASENEEIAGSEELESDEDLDLSGIEDDEIDSYLLEGKEVENKTTLWLKENKEYLDKQAEKRMQEDSETFPKSSNQKNTKGKTSRKSNKINYDVLKNLNPSPSSLSDKQKVKVPAKHKRIDGNYKSKTVTNEKMVQLMDPARARGRHWSPNLVSRASRRVEGGPSRGPTEVVCQLGEQADQNLDGDED